MGAEVSTIDLARDAGLRRLSVASTNPTGSSGRIGRSRSASCRRRRLRPCPSGKNPSAKARSG